MEPRQAMEPNLVPVKVAEILPELKRRVDALFTIGISRPPVNRLEASAFCARLQALGDAMLNEVFPLKKGSEASASNPSKRLRRDSVVCNGGWEERRRSVEELEAELGVAAVYEPCVMIDLLCRSSVRPTSIPVRMFTSYFFSSGCRLWDASVGLARWIARNPRRVSGRRVLEVGAGCGCTGLAAAACGARVFLTDNDAQLLPNLRWNAAATAAAAAAAPRGMLHRPFVTPEVQLLDWADAPERLNLAHGTFDVILAADVVYSSFCADALVAVICALLTERGELIMCNPQGRHGVKPFFEALRSAGFVCEFSFLPKELFTGCAFQGDAEQVQAHQFTLLIASRPARPKIGGNAGQQRAAGVSCAHPTCTLSPG
jgi:predicted nicotinamide N-methyase